MENEIDRLRYDLTRTEARATALMDAAATSLDRRTREVFHERYLELFNEALRKMGESPVTPNAKLTG